MTVFQNQTPAKTKCLVSRASYKIGNFSEERESLGAAIYDILETYKISVEWCS